MVSIANPTESRLNRTPSAPYPHLTARLFSPCRQPTTARPHSGADLANWIQYLGGLLRTTVSVEELEAHHPRLRELNLWYRNHVVDFDLTTEVYYEKRPVAGILVVNETNADPGIVGVAPIPVDEDRVPICKPTSNDSQIYRRVKHLVEEVVSDSRPR